VGHGTKTKRGCKNHATSNYDPHKIIQERNPRIEINNVEDDEKNQAQTCYWHVEASCFHERFK